MLPKEVEPNYPASHTGGVKPMSIRGRFYEERERLGGEFTEKDREWRRKWLKDQELSPNEPRPVPELEQELRNPIRRFYGKPWDMIQEKLVPIMGKESAMYTRYFVPRIMLGILGIYGIAYYFKYNANTWERHGGWYVRTMRPAVVPGDPGFPQPSERSKPADYADRGFKSRGVFKD